MQHAKRYGDRDRVSAIIRPEFAVSSTGALARGIGFA
jgi:hypothetical protein